MNEKCLSCGAPLDPVPGGVEVVLHGFVSLHLLSLDPVAFPIAKGMALFCQTCAATNKVPFLEGAVFSEILRAAQKQGKN
jgi:hypothetical protein